MKNLIFLIILLFLLSSILLGQETVNLTFRHYPTQANVYRAFVPGTFNNWGPNNGGTIATDAPSLMTYIDSLGFYVKIYQFTVGETHNYKFHEHHNASGTEWQWFTDPLNPRVNVNDNNNSIITIENAMIFEIFPKNGSIITEPDFDLTAGVFVTGNDSILADQSTILLDGAVVTTFQGKIVDSLSIFRHTITDITNGNHTITFNLVTKNGIAKTDSIQITYQGEPPVFEVLPEGVTDGVNIVDDNTVTLVLHAPYYKDFVYVIGDFNDWQIDQNYFMKRTPDLQKFWLTINNLQPQQFYRFQYFVDGEIRIADPYAELVLDPWNDQYIGNETYPGLISYPTDKTSEIVGVFKIDEEEYSWQIPEFDRPHQKDLIIYELLLRDFLAEHNYQTLIDTLNYFEKLGVNAIELMPVNEFEGNSSWGYNPSFYFAPDKYYGPENELKRFIDECHKRGIAVLIDMVLNHSFGQSPMVRLFAEGIYGPPDSHNPWFNADIDPNYGGYQACHPYNVGYDFNHEKFATKEFVDRVNKYWLTEFKVDGFRFDLTKGLTQRVSYAGNGSYNEGYASQYDASRIAILKRMADEIWEEDSTAYVILEHFADNSEETELADYGLMLWGNLNRAYSQSAMGWLDDPYNQSGLSWGYFKQRGWSKPGLVTYMESHDEPWLMYKNLQYGRSNGSYNIKELRTALNRIKLCAAFFLTLPGPKMMWQFGELGYDQELPGGGGRTGEKPILWNYYNIPERKGLFEAYSAIIKLRKDHEVFRDPDATVQFRIGHGIYGRRINISNDTMNVTIIGNFGVSELDVNPNFQVTGDWYDYFTGEKIYVSDTQSLISLLPGEFHIYTDNQIETPSFTSDVKANEPVTAINFSLQQNYPNPFNPETWITYQIPVATNVKFEIYNLQGQKIKTLINQKQSAGVHRTEWKGTNENGELVTSGLYLYKLSTGSFSETKKMLLLR